MAPWVCHVEKCFWRMGNRIAPLGENDMGGTSWRGVTTLQSTMPFSMKQKSQVRNKLLIGKTSTFWNKIYYPFNVMT